MDSSRTWRPRDAVTFHCCAIRPGKIRGWLLGSPDLAIEVLSPTHEERDRIVKRDLYAKYGVPEFWIVDPATRLIEVRSLDGASWKWMGGFGEADELRSPLLPDLRLPVREVFE